MNRNVTKEILDPLCHISPEISKIFLFVRDHCVLPEGNRISWYPGNCPALFPVIDGEHTTDTAFCKGCGSALKECTKHTIAMVREEK
jgi:Pyruvate/2-oxoacid:ferredoxin oxidoreductase delta subunit